MEVVVMTTGIYKIENNINHKVYIGQSVRIERRWQEHKYLDTYLNPNNASYYRKLYTAFREEGIDNFTFSIIEECSYNELDDREIYWIDYYNSYLTGYNMTRGGQVQMQEMNPVYSYDRYGNFVREYTSVKKASEELGINPSIIWGALSRHHLGYGFQWSYQKTENMPFYNGHSYAVIAYNLDGTKYKLYNSLQEAIKDTNDSYDSILSSCNTYIYNKTQYQWRYAIDFYTIDKIDNSLINSIQSISQYDLNGNFIAHYTNNEEALKALGKIPDEGTNLSTCLNGKQKSFCGFLWTRYGDAPPIPYEDKRIGHKTSSSKRMIDQFDKQHNYIASYISAHEAARQIGKPKCANHITECCQGKRKTCEGYIWQYKE